MRDNSAECFYCAGCGFIWRSSAGILTVEKCPECSGRVQHAVTFPRDLFDPALEGDLKRLEGIGTVVCTQVWEKSWPRLLCWRVILYFPSGAAREKRHALYLRYAAERLYDIVKGSTHGATEASLVG